MVRFILIRGADTQIKNKLGHCAMDLAQSEIATPNLKRDVIKMLGPPGSLDCLMLSTPTRKMKKQPITLSIFLGLFVIIQAIVVVNIYPHLQRWQIIANLVIVLICAFSLLLSVCKNPGYLSKGADFIELLEVCDSTQLCPDCQCIRTTRSRHCSVCNRCVERFDHHCPWINNCVGLKTHNNFYVFVTFMVATLTICLTQSLYCLVVVLKYGYANSFVYRFVTVPSWAFFVMIGVQFIVAALFFIPVLWLCLIQSGNFANNKTTMERFTRQPAQVSDEDLQVKMINSGIINDHRVIVDVY